MHRRGGITTELLEVEGSIVEFEERQIAAFDQLKRVDLQAPKAGIRHEVAIHTADAGSCLVKP